MAKMHRAPSSPVKKTQKGLDKSVASKKLAIVGICVALLFVGLFFIL